MPILTTQFLDLCKNALVQWREEYESVEKAARQLYDIVPNENLTSEHSQIDSPGFARRKNEGGSYAIGSPRQGYTLNLTKSRIALGDAVTWEINFVSPALVTMYQKFLKLRETLYKTIRSETQQWGRSTTIIGHPIFG